MCLKLNLQGSDPNAHQDRPGNETLGDAVDQISQLSENLLSHLCVSICLIHISGKHRLKPQQSLAKKINIRWNLTVSKVETGVKSLGLVRLFACRLSTLCVVQLKASKTNVKIQTSGLTFPLKLQLSAHHFTLTGAMVKAAVTVKQTYSSNSRFTNSIWPESGASMLICFHLRCKSGSNVLNVLACVVSPGSDGIRWRSRRTARRWDWRIAQCRPNVSLILMCLALHLPSSQVPVPVPVPVLEYGSGGMKGLSVDCQSAVTPGVWRVVPWEWDCKTGV